MICQTLKVPAEWGSDHNGTNLRRFPFGLSLSKPSLPFDKNRANGRIWQAIALKSVPLGSEPNSGWRCWPGSSHRAELGSDPISASADCDRSSGLWARRDVVLLVRFITMDTHEIDELFRLARREEAT